MVERWAGPGTFGLRLSPWVRPIAAQAVSAAPWAHQGMAQKPLFRS